MKKILLDVSIILVFIILLFSMFCLMNGSLEMYPTAEQEGKIKIVFGLLLGISVISELVLVFMRFKLKVK
ncbi:MAG: hypothetical protein Q4D94_04705 [Bacillota bacterium]|nr:hypothetical protein [Bacillota bacterium]